MTGEGEKEQQSRVPKWLGKARETLKGAVQAGVLKGFNAYAVLEDALAKKGIPGIFGASVGEINNSLRGVDPQIDRQARELRNRFRTAADDAERQAIRGEFRTLLNENPSLDRFADYFGEEVRGEVRPGEPSRLEIPGRAVVVRPEAAEPLRREEEETGLEVERNLVNIRRLDAESAEQILLALEVGMYGITARGLDVESEKNLLVPARIEGRTIHDKQELINRCVEQIDRRNSQEDREFLKDFQMARAIHRFYYGVHQAVQNAVDGMSLEMAINNRQAQTEFPPSDPDHADAPGHYSRWVYYFLEKNVKNRQQYFEIYHAADLDFVTIRNLARGNPENNIAPDPDAATEMLNAYFAGLENQEIFIDEDVRENMRHLFTSQDLDQRAKLDRLMRLREIWYVPYATHRYKTVEDSETHVRKKVRQPDIYPTERASLSLDLEDPTIDIRPIAGKAANSHLATRIRGIKGVLTGVEDFLLHGNDLHSWYYHNNRYALVTRILCLTALGMHVYDRYFDKFADFQGRAGVGSDLNFKLLAEYANIPLRGDWFGFLEGSRQTYNPDNLRARGFSEQRVRELQHCLSRQGVIEHLAQAYTERDGLPLTGREYRGRSPEGINLLNEDICRNYWGAAYYSMIAETCGDPEMSWRAAWVNQWQGDPGFHARYYLLHLNQLQGDRNELGEITNPRDVVDKELVYWLFHLRPEFEHPDVYDASGKRLGTLDERVFLQKIMEYTNGWESAKRERLIAQCADNPNVLMAEAIREMASNGLFSEIETAYLTKDPEMRPRIIAKERALRHYEQWTRDVTFDLLYTLATQKRNRGFLLYDEKTGEHFTTDEGEIRAKVTHNEEVLALLQKVQGLSTDVQRALLTTQNLRNAVIPGFTADELNLYQWVRQSLTPQDQETFNREYGLDEHEKQVLKEMENDTLRPTDIIDENILLEKIRFNRIKMSERLAFLRTRVATNKTAGSADVAGFTPNEITLWRNRERRSFLDFYDQDGGVTFSDAEKRYWGISTIQARLEAINRIEAQRERQEINAIRLKNPAARTAEEVAFLDNLEAVETLKERANFNRQRAVGNARVTETSGFTPEEISLWNRRHQLEYWTMDPANFRPEDRRDLKEMELLLTWFNWPEMRRVYNLDFPWLDLQQRQFFSYTLDWAILNKIGVFGEDPERPWEENYPFEKPDVEDPVAAILEQLVHQKELLRYRFGNGLTPDKEIESIPIVGEYTGVYGKSDMRGDPALNWEYGDGNLSFAWLQAAQGRWTPPATLAAHNRIFHFLNWRLNSSPRVVRAMGQHWDRKEVAYRLTTPWDLFATRAMDVKVMGGFFKIATNESGIYDVLTSAGMDHLSPWIMHHLLINEGRFVGEQEGLGGKALEGIIKTIPFAAQIYMYRNRKEPKNFRQLMWELGIEDLKTGDVGGEKTLGSFLEFGLGSLPVELGKIFPAKGLNLLTGPRLRTIQYFTEAGAAIGVGMGVVGGPVGMLIGGGGGALTGLAFGAGAMVALQAVGVYELLKDAAIRNLVVWDWAFDPDKKTGEFLQEEQKKEEVIPYK